MCILRGPAPGPGPGGLKMAFLHLAALIFWEPGFLSLLLNTEVISIKAVSRHIHLLEFQTKNIASMTISPLERKGDGYI